MHHGMPKFVGNRVAGEPVAEECVVADAAGNLDDDCAAVRSPSGEPLDPRIRRIAEAIGRQLARAQGKPPAAANDNEPRRRPLKRLPKTRLGFSSCMAHLHRCDERMQRFLRANHIAGY
jgi:hypothetical protein